VSPEPQLRVLLVPSAYYPHVGGIEELTRQLALELGRLGHGTLVLTNRWPDGVAAAETLDGVPPADAAASNGTTEAAEAEEAPAP
jgi:hypothetical protein